jgi:hypothetical protein
MLGRIAAAFQLQATAATADTWRAGGSPACAVQPGSLPTANAGATTQQHHPFAVLMAAMGYLTSRKRAVFSKYSVLAGPWGAYCICFAQT